MSALRVKHGYRRGVMLVEAALMLSLLMTLTFAIFEYGWIFIKSQELRNAASTGARIGSLAPEIKNESMTAKAQARVNAMLADYKIVGASVTYDPPDFDNVARGDPVRVAITVVYDGNVDLQLVGFPLIPVPANLAAEATFPKQ